MTPAKQTQFNYDSLDPKTRGFVIDKAETIHNHSRIAAKSIVAIGGALIEVKQHLHHGQFLDWIEKEFGWKKSSAENFMHVAECFKSPTVGNLDVDCRSLYQIAAPSFPEPIKAIVIEHAQNGGKITHTGLRAVVAEFEKTGVMPDFKVDLPRMLSQTRKLLSPPEISEDEPRISDEQRPMTSKADEQARRERIERNNAETHAFFTVVRAIESLSDPLMPMCEVVKWLDRFDTPDKDWKGRAPVAFETLKLLCKELHR